MNEHILVTGGAGFIGSHLADELLEHGYRVRVLDCLSPQVHGTARRRPLYLDDDVELLVGDIRDAEIVERALDGIDAVYHFAAAVGVGQSMYEIAHYTSVNNLGTAVLLEALVKKPVERQIVASSMSVYGEGAYLGGSRVECQGPEGTSTANLQFAMNDSQFAVSPLQRTIDQLRRGQWDPIDDAGRPLMPIPTPETKPPVATSVYALSKYDQERLCLVVGDAYSIPTVALRFFNVYGPRQALSNPYTGVLAIFASRYLSGRPPVIFEDGFQQRDFVNVHDVARGCRLALESPEAAGEVFNIGSGEPITIRRVAEEIAAVLGREDLPAEVSHKYRAGDIRHCFADISKARRLLGYEPQVAFRDGLAELAEWLKGQQGQIPVDRFTTATEELAARGLVV